MSELDDLRSDNEVLVAAYGDLVGVAAILAGSIRLYLHGDGTRENMKAALDEFDARKPRQDNSRKDET